MASESPPTSIRDLPWRERFVLARDGTRLFTRFRAGEGQPAITAVLCDGIACDGFIWRYLAEDLLPLAHVLHWNYRGHGRSGGPVRSDWVDISAFASDLGTVRSEIDTRCGAGPGVVLFGHSLGCQTVLESYRAAPDGVAAMVLICGAPGRVTHSFKGSDALARALPGLIERVERHPQLARALWGNVPPAVATRVALATGEVDAGVEPADILPYMEHVADLDLHMFLRMLHAVGEQTAADMLGDITAPVLVIAGGLDTFTPTHLAEEMAAAIPGSEIMIEPDATHVVPLERRGKVRERITDFLRRRVLGDG